MKLKILKVILEKNKYLKDALSICVPYELVDDEGKSYKGKYTLATFGTENKDKAAKMVNDIQMKFSKKPSFTKTIQHYALMTHLKGVGMYDKHKKLFEVHHKKLYSELQKAFGLGR